MSSVPWWCGVVIVVNKMNYGTLHNTCIIPRISYFCKLNACVLKRTASSLRAPDAVFLEKCVENPVIVVPQKNKVDIIGPPNAVTNLRPIIRQRLLHETPLQQKLRELQDETQTWNEKFWLENNTKFISERENFIKSRLKADDERKTLSADEMSEFYKWFLDRNWKAHVWYNFEWYKRNFMLLYFSLRVNLEYTRNI